MQRDESGSSSTPWYRSAWRSCYGIYEQIYVLSNREPLLTIRRVVWVLSAGWVLFSLYAVAALAMITSIVFIPFVPSTARFAILALDTVTIEHYVPAWQPGVPKTWSSDPVHPFCIAANLVWLLTFGWTFAIAHLAAALVQVCTIINIASAATNVQLALFVLWPFGQDIRRRFLPTSIEELRDHEANNAEQQQPLFSDHSNRQDANV